MASVAIIIAPKTDYELTETVVGSSTCQVAKDTTDAHSMSVSITFAICV